MKLHGWRRERPLILAFSPTGAKGLIAGCLEIVVGFVCLKSFNVAPGGGDAALYVRQNARRYAVYHWYTKQV
jgi:hypothetical protein